MSLKNIRFFASAHEKKPTTRQELNPWLLALLLLVYSTWRWLCYKCFSLRLPWPEGRTCDLLVFIIFSPKQRLWPFDYCALSTITGFFNMAQVSLQYLSLDVTANWIREIHCLALDGFDLNTVHKLSSKEKKNIGVVRVRGRGCGEGINHASSVLHSPLTWL